MLWAEGTGAGILLFWHGQRLLARFGPDGLMMIGGAAGIIRWILSGRLTWLPSIVVLQPLHAFTFGASYLGAMHFLSRATPFSAAAGAQSIYVAVSSGLGGGLVMVLAGALYADYGGMAYLFMAVLSAAGLKRFQTAKDGALNGPEAPLRFPFGASSITALSADGPGSLALRSAHLVHFG